MNRKWLWLVPVLLFVIVVSSGCGAFGLLGKPVNQVGAQGGQEPADQEKKATAIPLMSTTPLPTYTEVPRWTSTAIAQVSTPTATVIPPTATAPVAASPTASPTLVPTVASQSTTTGAQVLAASSVTVTNVVADSLVVLGYKFVDEFFVAWGLRIAKDVNNLQAGEIDPREIATCPGEPRCVRLLREKNFQAYIMPFWVQNPTSCTMDGWMDSPEDRVKFGRKEPSTALGSGIPAGWSGLAQGITIRPCNIMAVSAQSTMTSTAIPVPAVTASLTPVSPTAVPQSTPTSGAVAWTEQNVRTTFGIDNGVKLAVCPDEKNCWVITGQGFVTIDNPTDCWLTGYRQEQGALMPGQTDKKTGIPPHSVRIKVEVVQFRPCAP